MEWGVRTLCDLVCRYVLLLVVSLLGPASHAKVNKAHLDVYLNVINCQQHSKQIAALSEVDARIPTVIHLSAADRQVGPQMLEQLGYRLRSNDELKFQAPGELSKMLGPIGASMVEFKAPSGVLFRFPLDEIPNKIDWINHAAAACLSQLSSDADLSKNSSYLLVGANDTGIHFLDKVFNTLTFVSIDSLGRPTGKRVKKLDGTFLKEAFAALPSSFASHGGIRTMFSLEIVNWSPGGLVTCSPSEGAGLAFSVIFDNRSHAVQGDSLLSIRMLAFFRDTAVVETYADVGPHAWGSDYISYYMDNFSQRIGKGYTSVALKFQNVSSPEYLFHEYQLTDSGLVWMNFSKALYPQALWEAGFQYNFISGAFSAGFYSLNSYPMLIGTSDGRQIDLTSTLGIDRRKIVPGKGAYLLRDMKCDAGLASMLYVYDEQVFWCMIDIGSGQLIQKMRLFKGKNRPKVNMLAGLSRAYSINKLTGQMITSDLFP